MGGVGQKLRGGAGLLRVRLLGRPRPLFVGWAVTKRCNYRCRYCRVWEDDREMGTAQALDLVHQIAQAGAIVLGFTGGEPLLREDLGELIRLAARRGLAVYLFTNGALLPERAELLSTLRRVTVSLDGPPDVHDAIRGSGAFAKAVAAVETARRAGVQTRLSATIHAGNVNRLDEILALATELSVRVVVQPALRTQLGSDHPSLVHADRAAYRAALGRLLHRANSRSRAACANSLPCLRHLSRWPEDAPISCVGGLVACRIEPNGDVYHCGRVHRERPHQNALAAGFETAFRSLDKLRCRQCWCANRIELSLLYQLKPDVILNGWWTS